LRNPSLKFAAAAANKIKSVFPGDMCVGENTSQPAKVEMAAAGADIEAMQRAASISPAKSKNFAGDLRRRIVPPFCTNPTKRRAIILKLRQ